jgi:hypothetical protein
LKDRLVHTEKFREFIVMLAKNAMPAFHRGGRRYREMKKPNLPQIAPSGNANAAKLTKSRLPNTA